jgi:hypothetical protein
MPFQNALEGASSEGETNDSYSTLKSVFKEKGNLQSN